MTTEQKKAQEATKAKLKELGLLQVIEEGHSQEELIAKIQQQNEEIIEYADKVLTLTKSLEEADATIGMLKLELEKQQGTPKQK